MKKKGFTLIEIIVAISLIAVIGTASFFGVRAVNNNLKNKKIEKAYSVFDNALEVYLSEHSEIYDNLAKNTEGAIVTLEVLKNEGLVDDNIKDPVTKEKIDYKNNYYVLSDAVLLSDPVEGEDACEGQVSIEVLKSWKDLTETGIDTSKVLYICPKEETPQESEKISQLEEKVRALQAAMALLDIGEKNYVYFDVNPGNGNELASGLIMKTLINGELLNQKTVNLY